MIMLQKILRIKNTARFHDENPGSLKLSEFNIVFAENGCGKTTLSAIMHSVAQNEPGFINERVTVGKKGDPRVKLLTGDNQQLYYSSGSWEGPVEEVNVQVFDSHFVNTNIFAGHTLSHDHKKKLHRFIIGDQGKDFSKRINRLDTISRDLSDHIRETEQALSRLIESENLSVDEFLRLDEVEDFQSEIRTAKAAVKSQRRADELLKKNKLSEVTFPDVPVDKIENILLKTLDDISRDAEATVKQHMERCTNAGGEAWIETGMTHLASAAECPFCGQDLTGVELVEAYRDYFNDKYENLKASIDGLLREIENCILPANGWKALTSNLEGNQARYESWTEYIDVSYAAPEELDSATEEVWKKLRTSLTDTLETKKSAPLEPVEISGELQAAVEAYDALNDRLDQYRETVQKVNRKITSLKSNLDEGSLSQAKTRLARLNDQWKRHSGKGKDLSKRLEINRTRKAKILEAKQKAKDELDEYQSDVLVSCQEGINEFLRKAGADFRIEDTKVGYQGGTANARFSIVINEEEIGLGNAITEVGQQSFRTLLSEGDKNTLAFAFFYARIRDDSNLDDKIVVVDDPISSLDEHRRRATQDAVLELARKAKQVILLSHSPRFLSNVWQSHNSDGQTALFQIRKTGDKTSELTEWAEEDINKRVQDPYFQHFDKLVAYSESREGEPEEVARSIRLVLEGNLRRRFADKYKRDDGSISAFIGKVNNAPRSDPLASLQGTEILRELEEINEYCHDPHHDDDPYQSQQINENELASFVKRTVDFARGIR